MELPLNHKTVILIDRGAYQRSPSGISHDVNRLIKSRSDSRAAQPILPVPKSIWTCCVISSLEYARMAWDVYPCEKLVSIFVNDRFASRINSWDSREQQFNHVMAQLSDPARVTDVKEADSFRGIKAAVSALSERTEAQKARWPKGLPPSNKGRIIYFTHLEDTTKVKRLMEAFVRSLNEVFDASKVMGSEIAYVEVSELLVVNVNRMCEIPKAPDEEKKLSQNFTYIVNSVSAERVGDRMRCYALEHFDLASLTVTGIPMKEEHHSNASTNYDVEVFHPKAAHLGQDGLEQCRTKTAAGYETATLRWVAPPRADAAIMNLCYSVHRVTFAEVFSRPSTCLTNFILGGRIVMLEMPRRDGGRRLSHMLSSYKDEIFIHSMMPQRHFDDVPCITEGVGSRLADYRTADFAEVIEANILAEWPAESPVPAKMSGNPPELSGNVTTFVKHNIRRLRRYTAYFPLNLSATLLPNLRPHIDTLLTIMVKRVLSVSDANEAKRVMYGIYHLETKGELVHLIPPSTRQKSSKRDGQYKEMWDELLTFVRANARSKYHKVVYRDLLCLRGKEVPRDMSESTVDLHDRAGRKRPADAMRSHKSPMTFRVCEETVLDLWNTWLIAEDRSRGDFPGHDRSGSGVEKLYPALNEPKEDRPPGGGDAASKPAATRS